ncbi:MAG: hypothetical protein AAFP24_05875 [Pseudomonadota bacterium]
MTESVIIRRCATLSEALICNSFLQTEGILSSIDNEHHAAVQWTVVPAIGGVHIRVPVSQFDEAKALIIERVEHAEALLDAQDLTFQPIERTRYLRAASMLIISLGFFNLLATGAIFVIDQIIPAAWFPANDAADVFYAPAPMTVLPGNGFNSDGYVFLFIIALFLIWELFSTRAVKPIAEPQV